jgi:hypothetical protein
MASQQQVMRCHEGFRNRPWRLVATTPGPPTQARHNEGKFPLNNLKYCKVRVSGPQTDTWTLHPLLTGYQTRIVQDYQHIQIKGLDIFLLILGAHMKIILVIEVKDSLSSSRIIYVPSNKLIIEPRKFNKSLSMESNLFKTHVYWCLLVYPIYF